MANEKAIYQPGELDKVKQRLGPVDDNEAKRMQKILGGEVGKERESAGNKFKQQSYEAPPAGGSGNSAKKVHRAVDIAANDETEQFKPRYDVLTPVKPSYFERIKLDSCCG